MKKKGHCYIFGAGEFSENSFAPLKDDFIIAADGGYRHIQKLRIEPHLVLGDFDSLGYIPQDENVFACKAEKDDTDTMLAVRAGFERGYSDFIIFGGLGGRLDHTMANLQALVFISRSGGTGQLINRGQTVTAITNSQLNFDSNMSGIISVFCSGNRAEGVFLTGLKYPLINAVLTDDMPLGISNEFTGTKSSVRVENGTLIIMHETIKAAEELQI